MSDSRREKIFRATIVGLILLAGVAMAPFVDLPVKAINWQSLAGVYDPDLIVNATSGEPGSFFLFTGSNYPANSTAVVYVNGEPLGPVAIDGAGGAQFLLNTQGAAVGSYNVTLEVDINASATQSIELVANGSTILPPPNYNGPIFYVGDVLYLPVLRNP